MTARILVTGSRDWWCRESIAAALDHAALLYGAGGGLVLVHGGAQGADTLAAEEAELRGWSIEPHPVTPQDWNRWGRAAGPRRNAYMISLRASACLAFPLHDPNRRTGTEDCMDKARRARIPIHLFRPMTPRPKET